MFRRPIIYAVYMRDAYMRDKIAENIMKLTINYKKVSFNEIIKELLHLLKRG